MKAFVYGLVCGTGILMLFPMLVSVARAEVVVQDSDLSSGASRYRMAFIPSQDFGPNNEALDAKNPHLKGALVSSSNLRYIVEPFPSGASFIAPIVNTRSEAQMTLGWDFTQSAYRPTSVDLTGLMVVFNGDAGNSSVITLSWSTDNQTWTPYATISGRQFLFKETKTVSLSSPDHFYIKCEFTDIPSNLDVTKDQWGRVQNNPVNGQNEAFSADFTMDRAPLK